MAEAAAKKSFKQSWDETVALFKRRETIAMLGLGFASGLPLLLVLSTLSVWLRQAGVSRTEIGLLSWALLAYALKPFWAPLVDRFKLPVLYPWLGMRRSWMFLAQAVVLVAIAAMAFGDPRAGIGYLATWAVILAFASATLDIAIDAWRIESGTDQEQGALAAAVQLGYRIAIFFSGAVALYIVSIVSGDADPKANWELVNQAWAVAYGAMAALTLLGFWAILYAREPASQRPAREAKGLKAILSAVMDPFVEFFTRERWLALVILGFIFLSRIPEFFMGPMANPMYVDTGYTPADIATASKVLGVWVTIIGAIVGGVLVARYGVAKVLALGVASMCLPNMALAWVAVSPPNFWILASGVSLDNFCNGVGGTIFIAYMTAYSSRAFAATQYAFLVSLSMLPGRILAGVSGVVVDEMEKVMGQAQAYAAFFIGTALMAVPAILLAFWCARLLKRRMAGEASAEATNRELDAGAKAPA